MFKSEEWLRMDRGKPGHVGLSNTAGKALAEWTHWLSGFPERSAATWRSPSRGRNQPGSEEAGLVSCQGQRRLLISTWLTPGVRSSKWHGPDLRARSTTVPPASGTWYVLGS